MLAGDTTRQRIEDFDAKHGGSPVLVDGWWLLPDGAMREQSVLGALCEPSPDQNEQTRVQRVYQEELRRQVLSKAKQNIPPPPPPQDPARVFDAEHGRDAINIDGWLVYSDGAMRECNLLGALVPPPAEPYERCKIQVHYQEEKLKRAVQEFNDLKNHLLTAAKINLKESRNTLPPPDQSEAERRLKALQVRVKIWKDRLDKACKALDENKPAWLRGREAAALSNRELNEQFVATIKQIEV